MNDAQLPGDARFPSEEPSFADAAFTSDGTETLADDDTAQGLEAPLSMDNAEPETLENDRAHPWRGALTLGVGFALVGVVVGLRAIAIATLPHILLPGQSTNYQEIADGLPVPRLLDWNVSFIELLMSLRDAGPGLLALERFFLFGALWILIVRALNPTFRLLIPAAVSALSGEGSQRAHPQQTSAPDVETLPEADQSDIAPPLALSATPPPPATALNAALEFHGLMKAVTLLLLVGLPVVVVFILTGAFDVPNYEDASGPLLPTGQPWGVAWALRWMLLGATLLVGFHRDGVAGSFAHAEFNPVRRAWARLLLLGAGYGLVVFALGRWLLYIPLDETLLVYQTLGTFHMGSWNEITWHYLPAVGAAWFAAGTLLYLLGRPGLTLTQRLRPCLLPLIAVLLAIVVQQPLTDRALGARMDMTPSVLASVRFPYSPKVGATGVPDGQAAGEELMRRTGASRGNQPAQPERSVLVFNNRFITNVRQNGYTEDGLTADTPSAQKMETFLRSRQYRTALSWVAIKHLFNVGAVHFHATETLAACLLDLQRCPHMAQCNSTLESLFFTCSASPQNLALLDAWADERDFAYPDRESRRLLGDLYRRFGDVSKAMLWYRKAEMPRSFQKRVLAEKPLFHTGRVSGVLRLNGRPMAGVQVGVVPVRMNGLPKIMEPVVIRAAREIDQIDGPSFSGPLFQAYHPRPWAFRWVSAGTVTDANGAYTLDNLTEGTYQIICTLPANTLVIPPVDPHLTAKNRPQPFTVNYSTPAVSLGTTELTFAAGTRR